MLTTISPSSVKCNKNGLFYLVKHLYNNLIDGLPKTPFLEFTDVRKWEKGDSIDCFQELVKVLMTI